MICVTDVYSREIIDIFLLVKCLSLSKTFNVGIYCDTIKVINVTLCMMVLLTELYLFIPTCSDLDHI